MSEATTLRPHSTASDQEIEHELDGLLATRSQQAAAYGPLFADVWETAAACMRGGKLLRPRLLRDAFDALTSNDGGSDVPRRSVTRLAAAIELLHYAFLLHDDVIDGDVQRRGRPNLIGVLLQTPLTPRRAVSELEREQSTTLHFARTSAILMGNLFLASAHQTFAREPLPLDARLRLLDLLDHAVTESVAGEHIDVALSDHVIPTDLATVLSMSRLKTATYTFELPLRAAGILAGSTPHIEDLLGQVGRHLGTAFQLQDDLLSTFGWAAQHGKDPFSDLREGKETAIIAYARTTTAWTNIEPCFGLPQLSLHDGNRVRQLLVECGAEAFLHTLIDEQVHACFDVLAQAEHDIPADVTSFVEDVVCSMEGRRS